METGTVSKVLSIIVILVGFSVMVGWWFHIPILTSILPHWVTMKFSTALSFVLSGIIVFVNSRYIFKESGLLQLILLATSFMVLLLMSSLLLSSISGISTGIEEFFVQEDSKSVKTVGLGRPSLGTMVSFVLIAISGVAVLLEVTQVRGVLSNIGYIVTVLGSFAIIGYLIDLPILYFYHEEYSTGMAFHTAILFVLLGFSLVRSSKIRSVKDINSPI